MLPPEVLISKMLISLFKLNHQRILRRTFIDLEELLEQVKPELALLSTPKRLTSSFKKLKIKQELDSKELVCLNLKTSSKLLPKVFLKTLRM